jgi:hypothetical protein
VIAFTSLSHASAGFLLSVFFHLENGGNFSISNVDIRTTWRRIPEDKNLQVWNCWKIYVNLISQCRVYWGSCR